MQSLGLRTDFVDRVSTAPTGTVSVSVTAEGQPDYTIFRPAAYDFVALDENRLKALASFEPEWIYFGTLQQTSANARTATRALLAACPHARRFYDLNLRKDSYTPELVMRLLQSADVLKLNEEEVTKLTEISEIPSGSLEHFCASHAKRFGLQTICVTLGADGCAVFTDGKLVRRQGYQVRVADAVGAGDAFAAAFVHGVSNGWSTAQVAEFANSVGALVASRTGPIPDWTEQEAETLRTMA
jgi:fructokinase